MKDKTQKDPLTPVHMLLTVVTCGAWLPAWGIMHGFHLRRQTAAAHRQAGYAMALDELEKFAISKGAGWIDPYSYVMGRRAGVEPNASFIPTRSGGRYA